ncbi:A24 family peptidase [Leifsonia sp. NCR5]|uniref:prepilin peptidase n=1 Tax=Leifsonia sp. NCR5 TaxID=1978342 RepID=UPI0015C46176|nr:A24 family peptidase [Leifsonia sp. NCR5]
MENLGQTVGGLVGVAYLGVVSLPLCATDLRERRLPNALVLPGLAFAALGVGWPALPRGDPPGAYVELALCWAAVIAVLCAAASGGGIGMGDVKLAALLTLVLGALAVERGLGPGPPVVALFVVAFTTAGLAVLSGAVVARGVVVARDAAATRVAAAGTESEVPLGPHLLVGFWAVAAAVVQLS